MTRCQSCNRPLRAAKSIAAGRGPRCAKLHSLEIALAAYTTDQIAKAIELVDDGAVVPSNRRTGMFTVVGSAGNTYLCTVNGCSCPAGAHGRRCYHRAAVIAWELVA